jgi:hypothetical protein
VEVPNGFYWFAALLNGTLSCLVIGDSVGNLCITFTVIGFTVYLPTLLNKYTLTVHIKISKTRTLICFVQIKKQTRSNKADTI